MSRMLDEIRQQPEAIEKTLRAEIGRFEEFRRILAKKRPRLVVLAARGTSDNAAQFGRYLIEITTGIPVSLSAPSVATLYGATVDYRDALVVAVSQSGESTDINVVLDQARGQGAMTVGITNEARSAMTNIAEHVFLVRAGKEKSVAATKTFTGQVLMFYLLAYALGGKILTRDLERLPAWAESALKLEPEIAALSERYRFMNRAVVVGRGLNYANAFEFALKMMETCYVVAERFSSADFLHGPVALVDQNFPVFVFAPSGVTWTGVREVLVKLRGLTAETVVVTDHKNSEAAKLASRAILLPDRLPEMFTPIPYIVPAQLFAASLAAKKGLNPDRPRALSKVTLTL